MKTKDFENFKISLNLNIEVDSSLRRITEKIKIIAQHRDPDLLRNVVNHLSLTDKALDSVITSNICDDENTED